MTCERQSPHWAGSGKTACLGGRLNCTTLAMLSTHPRQAFIDAMMNAGIVPSCANDVIADGRLHRFRIDGDKPGSRNGWAVLHLDGIPAGAFGHWRTGQSGTWRGGHQALTPAQRASFAAEIEQVRRDRERELLAKHQAAQQQAERMWAQAAPATEQHPYLVRKRIEAHGIRQLNEKLLVPMRDGDGVLWNVQSIYPDGHKRFLTGGRKRGLYHAIGEIGTELLIAEGYATAATLHEQTWKPVAVAFDCGNLEPVARVLRAKHLHMKITIAADNDTETNGNPGFTKATAAARAVKGFVAVPPEGFNDFNDAAVAELAA